MGFDDAAERYRALWTRLYPDPRAGSIPPLVLSSFPGVIRLIVDTMCYTPFSSLGGKALAEVLAFSAKSTAKRAVRAAFIGFFVDMYDVNLRSLRSLPRSCSSSPVTCRTRREPRSSSSSSP